MKKGKFTSPSCFVVQYLSYGVAVAETYIPKDPGNIYNDLTGNYGLLELLVNSTYF